jgi:hypothetical protein
MPSSFDGLQAAAFGAAAATFGVPATWAPSAGGGTYITTVLFKSPTNQERLAEAGYAPVEPTFEFTPAAFPGLFESIRAGGTETVTVDGTAYAVLAVEALFDGRTYLAKLETS